jgi:phage shock protein PspC (stress-responsive transcriptional regulator)
MATALDILAVLFVVTAFVQCAAFIVIVGYVIYKIIFEG